MPNQNLTVAIITVTRNRAKLLPQAIESIINQTYPNYQHIIVDDASNDETRDVIQSYIEQSAKIKYIHNNEQLSLCRSRNVGIKNSESEFVSYLDDDDIYYDNFLERMIDHFVHNPECQVAYCKVLPLYVQFDSDYNIVYKEYRRLLINQEFDRDFLLNNFNYIPCNAIMHRRSLFNKVGYFDENLLWTHDDWDLWRRMIQVTDFDYIKEYLAEYRWHDGSRSKDNPHKDQAREYILKKEI